MDGKIEKNIRKERWWKEEWNEKQKRKYGKGKKVEDEKNSKKEKRKKTEWEKEGK